MTITPETVVAFLIGVAIYVTLHEWSRRRRRR